MAQYLEERSGPEPIQPCPKQNDFGRIATQMEVNPSKFENNAEIPPTLARHPFFHHEP